MQDDDNTHNNIAYNDLEELPKLMTFRLARLQARANAHAARLLNTVAGISLSEWRIFVMIETNGKISPTQIIKLTQFDKGLISRTIKRMQQKDLLTIEANPNDLRSHLIDFTAKGLDIFKKARPAMRHRQQVFRDCLEPHELVRLFASFDRLEQALDQMEADQ